MTDIIEGTVLKIENWADGGGADVFLHQDDSVYYYEGKMVIPPGPLRLEVTNGEGKNSNKKLIVNLQPLEVNVAGGEAPKPGPIPTAPVRMLNIKEEDFCRMIGQKTVQGEVKFRTLEAASRIYASLNVLEKDPLAACRTVINMAEELSGYLS